jgi:hypothetical protein
VEGIASREGHNVAQICEAFLLAGSDAYKKQGSKFVKRALARLVTKPPPIDSPTFRNC